MKLLKSHKFAYVYTRHYIDSDYKRKLSQWELTWLAKFEAEYYCQAQYQRDTFFPESKDKKELNRADYVRKWDVMNRNDLTMRIEDMTEDALHDALDFEAAPPKMLKKIDQPTEKLEPLYTKEIIIDGKPVKVKVYPPSKA